MRFLCSILTNRALIIGQMLHQPCFELTSCTANINFISFLKFHHVNLSVIVIAIKI